MGVVHDDTHQWLLGSAARVLLIPRTGYIELWCALVLVVKRPMQSIKSTGIKLLIYWKSTKKAIISHNSCLTVETILGKCGSSLIPLLVLKKKVRAPQRSYLTLSNKTTQAIQKSCPIYSTRTLSQLDSN